VGEPPLMLALSVREALRAAVAAFGEGPQQRVELPCPATPEAVFFAIRRCAQSQLQPTPMLPLKS
jgi:xanthine dehydrogenase large subunit